MAKKKKRVAKIEQSTKTSTVDLQKKRIKELEKQLEQCRDQLAKSRASKFKLAIGKRKNTKGSQHCRVIIPDSHGCLIDRQAATAMLNDLSMIKPSEVVHLGDAIDCGSMLAAHQVLGYVADTTYTFEDDVNATNQFLDEIQERVDCPVTLIEGNHERRLERWCLTNAMRNSGNPAKDAEYLLSMFSVESVLNLEKRKIRLIKQGRFYDDLPLPATIRLGRCFFTHGSSTAKHAASVHLARFGNNVVFGHTHRADTATTRTVEQNIISAFNPGCLAKLQPLWQHTNPTTWNHGYGIQLVRSNGEFLHINVPVIKGVSLLSPLIEELT